MLAPFSEKRQSRNGGYCHPPFRKPSVLFPPRSDVRDRQSGPQQRTDRKRPIADVHPFGDDRVMSDDNLNWLTAWYLAQCDND